MANSNTIITDAINTDAFSVDQRGLALGLNQVAGIAGGLPGPDHLRAAGTHRLASGVPGLRRWTNPWVLGALVDGAVVLGIFVVVESRVAEPIFELSLFRIRAFTAGNLAGLLSAIGRGGLMFILIIWLQGIWLPRDGHNFADTPLWAGIYMLPLTVGFLVAGAISGAISDRRGARLLSTGGMVVAALSFVWFLVLPLGFAYWGFALVLPLNGVGMGLFALPNRAGILNSRPLNRRGVGAGLSRSLPATLSSGLTAYGVSALDAERVANLPPVSVLFSSLLGYNPVQTLLGPAAMAKLPPADADYLTGRRFFPTLISGPFTEGLTVAFWVCDHRLPGGCGSLVTAGRQAHLPRASPTVCPPIGCSPHGFRECLGGRVCRHCPWQYRSWQSRSPGTIKPCIAMACG
ncbi:hypothetical protein [Arthrobacter sp. AQ5-05]|uniref:hypothetical protein n=1 Tax=Arthrobacter sp. AQ5-05 TaxID=2184581 RepID=UPI001E5D895F|nr:hypothetical protein [Arthrobacter sp. AQ5-05]